MANTVPSSRTPNKRSIRASPSPPPNNRHRLDSKDIPRTYSGLYGTGGELTHQTVTSDLLPFELSRNRNTDWLSDGKSSLSLLVTYIFIIAVIQFTLVLCLPFQLSWTMTNVLHGVVSLVFLHWIKGSPNWYEQGELSAMTWWEQLSSSPQASTQNPKTVLFIVPTVLCHLACHFSNYDKFLSLVNVIVWGICIVAKLDWMNGVRILGINKTVGIDDDNRKIE